MSGEALFLPHHVAQELYEKRKAAEWAAGAEQRKRDALQRTAEEAERAEREYVDGLELEKFLVEFRALMARYPQVRIEHWGYDCEPIEITYGAASERLDDVLGLDQ